MCILSRFWLAQNGVNGALWLVSFGLNPLGHLTQVNPKLHRLSRAAGCGARAKIDWKLAFLPSFIEFGPEFQWNIYHHVPTTITQGALGYRGEPENREKFEVKRFHRKKIFPTTQTDKPLGGNIVVHTKKRRTKAVEHSSLLLLYTYARHGPLTPIWTYPSYKSRVIPQRFQTWTDDPPFDDFNQEG